MMNRSHQKNILVCGGMPRSGTTYLFDELSSYEGVFSSNIKESYLFTKPNFLIRLKLMTLPRRRVVLDFTPEYIFDRKALEKVLANKVMVFFIIRDYDDYVHSVEKYLAINGITNPNLAQVTLEQYDDAVQYVRENFISFDFNEVTNNLDAVINGLKTEFKLNLGRKNKVVSRNNSSQVRQYRFKSILWNKFGAILNTVRYVFLGIV